MNPRLNIVTLGVKDLVRSRRFYEDAMGWKVSKESDENIVFFPQGGIVVALFSIEGLAQDAGLSSKRSGFSGVSLSINMSNKEEVDAIFAKAISVGGHSLVEPHDTFWGGYGCYFADPEGHHWEIAWAPFWKFDDHGSLILE